MYWVDNEIESLNEVCGGYKYSLHPVVVPGLGVHNDGNYEFNLTIEYFFLRSVIKVVYKKVLVLFQFQFYHSVNNLVQY